jgi:hypothetical protein
MSGRRRAPSSARPRHGFDTGVISPDGMVRESDPGGVSLRELRLVKEL